MAAGEVKITNVVIQSHQLALKEGKYRKFFINVYEMENIMTIINFM